MLALGVASFGHLQARIIKTITISILMSTPCNKANCPIYRALTPTADERLIREFVLQLKLGHVSRDYFKKKFGVDVESASPRRCRP